MRTLRFRGAGGSSPTRSSSQGVWKRSHMSGTRQPGAFETTRRRKQAQLVSRSPSTPKRERVADEDDGAGERPDAGRPVARAAVLEQTNQPEKRGLLLERCHRRDQAGRRLIPVDWLPWFHCRPRHRLENPFIFSLFWVAAAHPWPRMSGTREWPTAKRQRTSRTSELSKPGSASRGCDSYQAA